MAVVKKQTPEEFIDALLENFCPWRFKCAKDRPDIYHDFIAERDLFVTKLKRLLEVPNAH